VAVRVVLAEDNYLVREGVGRLMDAVEDIELVAACADYDSLLAAVDAERPDVVVTDIRMPPSGTDEGIRAAAAIRERFPDVGVVVLSQYAEPAYALALLDRGSQGRAYLLKERVSDIDQLAAAIRQVADGGSVIDPVVVDALVEARAKAAGSPLQHLTPRETEILSEMAQGKNNAAVAASLVLSERAVEKHINSIFAKLALSQEPDVHRRVKAVLLFLAAQGTPQD
jgi:DNA-binding NarL/FixJ family response regulator